MHNKKYWFSLFPFIAQPGKPEGIKLIQTTPTSALLEVQAPHSDGGSPITSYNFVYDNIEIMSPNGRPANRKYFITN